MQQLWRWRKVLIVIGILVLVGLIYNTSQPRERLSLIESGLRDVLSPLQFALTRVTQGVVGVVEALKDVRTLRQRNAYLEGKVVELQTLVYQLSELKRENEFLREALEFKTSTTYDLLAAEVIGRNPVDWLSTVTINKGRSHGVEKGMAVITGTGVVGIVEDVTQFTSTILLAIDPRSAIGGMVSESGDPVLVEGDADNPGFFVLTPLDRDTVVEPGDVVLTSGLSRLFPKRIPIGEVVAVQPANYNLSFEAVVRPFVDFAHLSYVFVVLQDEIL
ncbi:MAG: rod shape-determining protein MreC [Firmicutes bacterium]|jgi:rod shape-determining protein MreC|nr:rod shape-determining protein MreC [Bacillota bacterium]